MTMKELALAIKAKKEKDNKKKSDILSKFDEKKKVKALTQAERLDRIEEILGLK